MLTTTGRNRAADGVAPTHLALHSAFPGDAGASELTGGSPAYARKAATFGAASGGVATQSGSVSFDVPAAATAQWIGVWSALTAGSCLAVVPVGGFTPIEFVVDVTNDLILAPAHGLADTNQIVFWGDTVPGGLTAGTIYFARDVTTDNFKVAATSGGAAINLTSQAGRACQCARIAPETYASQGTAAVSGVAINLNN